MTTEAVEPEAKQEVPATPPPDQPSPFQRIIDKFQIELGRLSGQLLVERTEREMEREQYIDQINHLIKQLQDAGVVPKSDGGQSSDAASGDAPVAPIRKTSRPAGAKKPAGSKKRR